MHNHHPTICTIDENCTVQDVRYHEKYDWQVLLKNTALFIEKDKREILADFCQCEIWHQIARSKDQRKGHF